LVSAFFAFFVLEAKAAPPIKIKVADAPQFLIAGQTHVFTLEVRNTSGQPFTFSLLPGFRSSVCWRTKQLGGCSGIEPTSVSCVSSTKFDTETGNLISKRVCSQPKDFVILPPKEARKFEVTVKTPDEIAVNKAKATVFFVLDSTFDGKDYDLSAWTGTIEFDHKLPVIKNSL